MIGDSLIVRRTRCWIETVVIAENFCPFAANALASDAIRFCVLSDAEVEHSLIELMTECDYLDSDLIVTTTLIILPTGFESFDAFLGLLELAERLIISQGYEGVYQLASFHPVYCFANAAPDDPANYTNRSPYPMLHLLREQAIKEALTDYPDPEQIPLRNIARARALGKTELSARLKGCQQLKKQ